MSIHVGKFDELNIKTTVRDLIDRKLLNTEFNVTNVIYQFDSRTIMVEVRKMPDISIRAWISSGSGRTGKRSRVEFENATESISINKDDTRLQSLMTNVEPSDADIIKAVGGYFLVQSDVSTVEIYDKHAIYDVCISFSDSKNTSYRLISDFCLMTGHDFDTRISFDDACLVMSVPKKLLNI